MLKKMAEEGDGMLLPSMETSEIPVAVQTAEKGEERGWKLGEGGREEEEEEGVRVLVEDKLETWGDAEHDGKRDSAGLTSSEDLELRAGGDEESREPVQPPVAVEDAVEEGREESTFKLGKRTSRDPLSEL